MFRCCVRVSHLHFGSHFIACIHVLYRVRRAAVIVRSIDTSKSTVGRWLRCKRSSDIGWIYCWAELFREQQHSTTNTRFTTNESNVARKRCVLHAIPRKSIIYIVKMISQRSIVWRIAYTHALRQMTNALDWMGPIALHATIIITFNSLYSPVNNYRELS